MWPEELSATGTGDLTTTGRRSGQARTVEIWFVVVDDRLHVVGTPGRRDWMSNLQADPRARFQVQGSQLTVDVEAEIILEPEARRRVAGEAWRIQPWYAAQGDRLEDWVLSAPMVALIPAAS